MQGAPRGGAQQRPPGGAGPRAPPSRRVALLRTTTPCGKEPRTPPVGQPTRGWGVSTVGRPENSAQGATEEGARCRVRRGGVHSYGRQRGGAQGPPHQAGRAAANHNPLREGAQYTPRRLAHKGAGR